MSWMAKLYETYEAGMQLDLSDEEGLMPISHTVQNAHINIVINLDGDFLRAAVLDKKQIILPATEKSAGRSGKSPPPHPLADKIQYVAQDYSAYGGQKPSFFDDYKKQLELWCQSEYRHAKAKAVYNYISRGRVVQDLVDANILYVDEKNHLLAYWPKEDETPPPIFKVMPPIPKNKRINKEKPEIEQGDALICWTVEHPWDPASDTWLDTSLQQSWIDYYASATGQNDLCHVLGRQAPISVNHPAKLRHSGDKAKILSANDLAGFTFRGRFTDSRKSLDSRGLQPVAVSFEASQKAHNALRWLINRQGYRNDSQVYVAWAVSGKKIPDPLKNSWEILTGDTSFQQQPADDHEQQQFDHLVDLGSSFAHEFKKYLAGYRSILSPTEQIVVMGLDSATPGRMSIIYYRELLASEFLERLDRWHDQFAWLQRYTIEAEAEGGRYTGKNKTRVIWPACSPSPGRIVETAYGDIVKTSKTLRKSTVERILPCIIDGRSFPWDLVESAVCRTSNRNNYQKWEWEKNLGVACALYKGYYMRHPDQNKRRTYVMALEKNRTTRDYLYGRLLAIAEYIEGTALRVAGEERPTTVVRLMQRFADHPFSTWRTIELALQPYIQRLKGNRAGFLVNRQKEMDLILSSFDSEAFKNDSSLSGEFLLGYHCQRQYWKEQKSEHNDTSMEEQHESE